jgi:hypothetical protein
MSAVVTLGAVIAIPRTLAGYAVNRDRRDVEAIE